jgi:hypothetical protein
VPWINVSILTVQRLTMAMTRWSTHTGDVRSKGSASGLQETEVAVDEHRLLSTAHDQVVQHVLCRVHVKADRRVAPFSFTVQIECLDSTTRSILRRRIQRRAARGQVEYGLTDVDLPLRGMQLLLGDTAHKRLFSLNSLLSWSASCC